MGSKGRNKLTDNDIDIIREVLRETGGSIRPAHRLLNERGIEVSYGSVHKVAKGIKRCLDPREPLVRSGIIKRLRKGWVAVPQLAMDLDCSEVSLKEAIVHLADSGYNVLWDSSRARILKGMPSPSEKHIDKSPLVGGYKVFGIVADTHICSHYQRLDVLESAYDDFAKQGITSVLHAGNIVDGHTTFNRFELYAHGITDQAHYLLDHYPERKGITTHFITGACHEGWWFKREGMDFGRYLTMEARNRGRSDLHYLGFQEADIELKSKGGSSILRIVHPGGGSAYALSYATQKMVESLQGGEKPAVLVVGHFHKAIYHLERNVHVLQAGCTQDQTPWMRGKKLAAHLGYWTLRLRQDKQGAVREIIPRFVSFYDRGYHVAMVV